MHLPFIRDCAQGCATAAIIGCNTVDPIIATLRGNPTVLYIYVSDAQTEEALKKEIDLIDHKVDIRWSVANPGKVCAPSVDMLLICNINNYSNLLSVLNKSGCKATRFILVHDTYRLSNRGSDGSHPGLPAAIDKFTKNYPEWKSIYNNRKNNGLTALKCRPLQGVSYDKTYSLLSFDVQDIKWVERYPIGVVPPQMALTEKELEWQKDRLNRALRYGMIVGIERNFTTIKSGNSEMDMWYVVYHVGFRSRPPGK